MKQFNINKNKITILMLLFLATLGNVKKGFAQQDAQYTQYMYNTSAINPAYAGSRDVLSINGLYRTQWIGLDGAPKTATFGLHSPINDRIGLGFSALNDKIGPSDESLLSIDFSYNIKMNDNYKLFFGIKGSANLLNIDYTKLDAYNPNDLGFQNNVDNMFSPNIGAGLYLQSQNTYVGLSVPNFLETNHYKLAQNSTAKEKMHYYLMAGHVFDLSQNVKFKPAFLTKLITGAPLQLDLTGNFLLFDKLTLGAAYRWDASLSGLVGFQISPELFAGYAYDADTTNLGSYNSGSHEVFLRFELFKNFSKAINPRFF